MEKACQRVSRSTGSCSPVFTDPLPLSIVEHYAYCPRQAALIHVDGI